MSSNAVMATFRPSSGDIALFVENGAEHAVSVVSVDEARALHGVLGQALRLADCAATPIAAVAGFAEGVA